MKAEIYRSGEGLLRGRAVFLSASKPTRDLHIFPAASEAEMDECVQCLARAIFAERGRLVFGALPTIAPLIVDVATEYFSLHWSARPSARPVTIYQSEAFNDVIPTATRRLEQLGYADIISTERRAGERSSPAAPLGEQCLESLAYMRARAFQETMPIAMVTAGGMQGIIREARLFLERRMGKIYTSNSLGGAAARLVPYLANNVLNEVVPIGIPGWQQQIVEIESAFEDSGWAAIRESKPDLPAHPYALLMQKVVQQIARESL